MAAGAQRPRRARRCPRRPPAARGLGGDAVQQPSSWAIAVASRRLRGRSSEAHIRPRGRPCPKPRGHGSRRSAPTDAVPGATSCRWLWSVGRSVEGPSTSPRRDAIGKLSAPAARARRSERSTNACSDERAPTLGAYPYALTQSVRVLTVFPSPPRREIEERTRSRTASSFSPRIRSFIWLPRRTRPPADGGAWVGDPVTRWRRSRGLIKRRAWPGPCRGTVRADGAHRRPAR